MLKKIIFWILLLEIIVSWPLSLIISPPKIKFETIFYPLSNDEQWDYSKKLALDTSKIKRFYYNKTTVFKQRYLSNFLVLTDLNNYFFIMHPREDVPGLDYRFKYPFVTILFLIIAIKVTINQKKYFKIWFLILSEMMVLSFLKQLDGFDLLLYIPITFLLYLGAKELTKLKYSWLVNIIFIFLIGIEIGRIFL
jgi:hypothetical protein